MNCRCGDWLKVDSGEDLEINIVGVIVVVLAIEFLGAVFTGRQGSDLGSFGIRHCRNNCRVSTVYRRAPLD